MLAIPLHPGRLLEALSIWFRGGAILFIDGVIAAAETCCCEPAPECCETARDCCLSQDAVISVSWELPPIEQTSRGEDNDADCPLNEEMLAGQIDFHYPWFGYTRDGINYRFDNPGGGDFPGGLWVSLGRPDTDHGWGMEIVVVEECVNSPGESRVRHNAAINRHGDSSQTGLLCCAQTMTSGEPEASDFNTFVRQRPPLRDVVGQCTTLLPWCKEANKDAELSVNVTSNRCCKDETSPCNPDTDHNFEFCHVSEQDYADTCNAEGTNACLDD